MQTNWVYTGASRSGFSWNGGVTVYRDTGNLVEAQIGEPNFKQVWWLERAVASARKVARIKLPNGAATGFLIRDDILMTNHHVFEDEGDAAHAMIQFNYKILGDDTMAPVDNWQCEPDSLFRTNRDLDYSIVRLKAQDGAMPGEKYGYFDLRHDAQVYENSRVNIIQHPRGEFQQIAFRDNQVRYVDDAKIQYLTDTDYGSSGSPVLDDWFNVVALHNQRVSDPNNPTRWYRNQGYRIDTILVDAGADIP
jgi:endonuclease G